MKSKPTRRLNARPVSSMPIAGMRTGLEDRRKTYAVIALFSLALLLVVRTLFSSSTSEAVLSASISRPSSSRSEAPLVAEQITLRTDLLTASEEAVYSASGRDIFDFDHGPELAIPRPVAPVIVPDPPAVAVAAAPPQPIPLKFFGFGSGGGGEKSIFLTNAENVFIAHEGDIVNRRYKILRASKSQVEVEDILTTHRETLPRTHE